MVCSGGEGRPGDDGLGATFVGPARQGQREHGDGPVPGEVHQLAGRRPHHQSEGIRLAQQGASPATHPAPGGALSRTPPPCSGVDSYQSSVARSVASGSAIRSLDL